MKGAIAQSNVKLGINATLKYELFTEAQRFIRKYQIFKKNREK